MTNEYIAIRTAPNGTKEMMILNDSPIDNAVKKADEKRGYTFEILEKLHPNWEAEALAKYHK